MLIYETVLILKPVMSDPEVAEYLEVLMQPVLHMLVPVIPVVSARVLEILVRQAQLANIGQGVAHDRVCAEEKPLHRHRPTHPRV